MSRSRDLDHILDGWMVGWGLGKAARSPGFGEDEGRAYSNNLGNAAAHHAYLWRRGSLIMSVIGLTEPGIEGKLGRDALRHLAEGMSARSQ